MENHFYREVAAKSSKPRDALLWLHEIEEATDCASLFSTISKTGQSFESLDFKISVALWKILKGDMHRKLMNEERQQTKANPTHLLSGRQIAYRIFEHFSLPPAERESLDVTHLVNLELKNDNLKGFNAKWDEITIQLREEPPEGWLEALYRKQLETSEQFAQILALYKNDISLKRAEPSYRKLKEMVEYYLADIQNQTHKKNLSANKSGLAALLANMKKKQA